MELLKAAPEHMDYVLRLYKSAFPAKERKPFSLIQSQAEKELMEILVAVREQEPVGFAITAAADDLVLLDYLAVQPNQRGKGYGSIILQKLQQHYTGKSLFLEIEAPDEHAPNQTERLARKAFYLRNHFRDAGIPVILMGVDMEILTTASHLTFQDCRQVYDRIYGPILRKFIKQR